MDFKQVIAVRSDLKMGKGKIAAQVAHGAVEASHLTLQSRDEWFKTWTKGGQKKVVVKVNSEEDISNLTRKARENGLQFFVVRDAGLTQVEPGTITALAIGPGPSDIIDKLTGELQLL